jgi:hypothetical protein
LLPKTLLLADFLRDLIVSPFSHVHLPEKAEVNSAFLCGGLPKLTRLPILGPERQTLGHLFLRGRSVVKQSVRLQDIVTKRVPDSPRIAIQAREQFSYSTHPCFLSIKLNTF